MVPHSSTVTEAGQGGEPENPPAFPQSLSSEGPFGGLTMRDWFAGQALAGITANHEWLCTVHSRVLDINETAAASAYEYADTMLAERAKGGAA